MGEAYFGRSSKAMPVCSASGTAKPGGKPANLPCCCTVGRTTFAALRTWHQFSEPRLSGGRAAPAGYGAMRFRSDEAARDGPAAFALQSRGTPSRSVGATGGAPAVRGFAV
jgi:hypothetical protein